MSDLDSDRREWTAFTRLARLAAAGHSLGSAAEAELRRLKETHPEWEIAPGEKSDFAVWSETRVGDSGDATALKDVSTAELLSTMRTLVESDKWENDGLWRRFVDAEPVRSFDALKHYAGRGDWNCEEWRELFYFLRTNDDRPLQLAVTNFLLTTDIGELRDSGHAITSWFEHKYLKLVEYADGPAIPLNLWDKFAETLIHPSDGIDQDVRQDPMMAVLNEPPGELAEVLINELNRRRLPKGMRLPPDLQIRFDCAVDWTADNGLTAQCAFLAQIPFLEYVAAEWVAERLAPLLSPNVPDALTRWHARFNAHKLGTPPLFEATKAGFLWTFDHPKGDRFPDGQILLLLQATYQATKETINLSSAEAKGALTRAGSLAMSKAARLLLSRDADDSAEHWQSVVKPIIERVWPADATLQTSDTTARLVDLALAAGTAFSDAVATLRPMILPAWESDQVWHFETDFDENGVAMLAQYPDAGLSLLDSLIPLDRGPSRLNELLDVIAAAEPSLEADPRFARLRGLAKRLAA